eukprot:g4707.t1
MVDRLPADEALRRTQEWGTLLCMDVPCGVQFGIDMSKRWTTGAKFKGMKMIPVAFKRRTQAATVTNESALHLVTFSGSDGAPVSTGVFVRFAMRDIRVWEWDGSSETLEVVPEGDRTCTLRNQVKAMHFDSDLAPYPIDQQMQWRQLISHVDDRVLQRCGLRVGTRILPGDPDLPAKSDATAKALTPYFPSTSRVARFTNVDAAKPKIPLKGRALTRFHLDGTARLLILLKDEAFFGTQDDFGDDDKVSSAGLQFLGELQLSFVLLLCLSSFQGLDQWKRLVKVVCDSERALAMSAFETFFLAFFDVLQTQLSSLPSDFFVDPLSSSNFLVGCLRTLDRNVSGLSSAESSLYKRFCLFKVFFERQFRMSIFEDEHFADEDGPTFVHESVASATAAEGSFTAAAKESPVRISFDRLHLRYIVYARSKVDISLSVAMPSVLDDLESEEDRLNDKMARLAAIRRKLEIGIANVVGRLRQEELRVSQECQKVVQKRASSTSPSPKYRRCPLQNRDENTAIAKDGDMSTDGIVDGATKMAGILNSLSVDPNVDILEQAERVQNMANQELCHVETNNSREKKCEDNDKTQRGKVPEKSIDDAEDCLKVELRNWKGERYHVDPDTALIYDIETGAAIGTWSDAEGPTMLYYYNQLSAPTLLRQAEKMRPWKDSDAGKRSQVNTRNATTDASRRPHTAHPKLQRGRQMMRKKIKSVRRTPQQRHAEKMAKKAEKVRLGRLARVQSTFKTSRLNTLHKSTKDFQKWKANSKKRDSEYSDQWEVKHERERLRRLKTTKASVNTGGPQGKRSISPRRRKIIWNSRRDKGEITHREKRLLEAMKLIGDFRSQSVRFVQKETPRSSEVVGIRPASYRSGRPLVKDRQRRGRNSTSGTRDGISGISNVVKFRISPTRTPIPPVRSRVAAAKIRAKFPTRATSPYGSNSPLPMPPNELPFSPFRPGSRQGGDSTKSFRIGAKRRVPRGMTDKKKKLVATLSPPRKSAVYRRETTPSSTKLRAPKRSSGRHAPSSSSLVFPEASGAVATRGSPSRSSKPTKTLSEIIRREARTIAAKEVEEGMRRIRESRERLAREEARLRELQAQKMLDDLATRRVREEKKLLTTWKKTRTSPLGDTMTHASTAVRSKDQHAAKLRALKLAKMIERDAFVPEHDDDRKEANRDDTFEVAGKSEKESESEAGIGSEAIEERSNPVSRANIPFHKSERPLPHPWVRVKDEVSGSYYYWNDITGESTWDRPQVKAPLLGGVEDEVVSSAVNKEGGETNNGDDDEKEATSYLVHDTISASIRKDCDEEIMGAAKELVSKGKTWASEVVRSIEGVHPVAAVEGGEKEEEDLDAKGENVDADEHEDILSYSSDSEDGNADDDDGNTTDSGDAIDVSEFTLRNDRETMTKAKREKGRSHSTSSSSSSSSGSSYSSSSSGPSPFPASPHS